MVAGVVPQEVHPAARRRRETQDQTSARCRATQSAKTTAQAARLTLVFVVQAAAD